MYHSKPSFMQKIRLLGMLAAISLQLLSSSAHAGSWFQPNLSCDRKKIGTTVTDWFYKCKAIPRPDFSMSTKESFFSDKVPDEIKSYRGETIVNYSFNCESDTKLKGYFSFEGQKQPIHMGAVTEELTFYIPLTGFPSLEFHLNGYDGKTYSVHEDCTVITHSIIAFPPIAALKAMSNRIVGAITLMAKQIDDLDAASTLPDKWIAIRNLEDSLGTMTAIRKARVTILKARITVLEETPESDRTAEENNALMDARAQADEISLEVQNIELLIAQTKAAMPENSPCNKEESLTQFCLDKVMKAKQNIRKQMGGEIHKAKKLATFMQSEIKRLDAISQGLSDQLSEILNDLNIATSAGETV